AYNPGSTQVEVSELTGLSAKTVSRVISILGETRAGRGWIRQESDPGDRRLRRLYLSRKGMNIHRKMMDDLVDFKATLPAV
ncbi:MAG: MarR family transcriptional regulator, partial [Lysobacterales bacterium]